MRTKLLFCLIVMAISCMALSAQSVIITGKKVTYVRPKPISDDKKTFTINYPKVKAETPAVSRKIELALSYESLLGLKLKEELDKYQWLEEANYKVKYNKNGVLCVDLWMEGTGAYSWVMSNIVVVDTRTGLTARSTDVFINHLVMVAMIRPVQEKEIQKTLARIKKEEPDADEPEILFGDRRFIEKDLDGYEVSDKGVTFHYDYGFPHVALTYEPDGSFFYPWRQLRSFIKRGGLLSRIAR